MPNRAGLVQCYTVVALHRSWAWPDIEKLTPSIAVLGMVGFGPPWALRRNRRATRLFLELGRLAQPTNPPPLVLLIRDCLVPTATCGQWVGSRCDRLFFWCGIRPCRAISQQVEACPHLNPVSSRAAGVATEGRDTLPSSRHMYGPSTIRAVYMYHHRIRYLSAYLGSSCCRR